MQQKFHTQHPEILMQRKFHILQCDPVWSMTMARGILICISISSEGNN